MLFGQLEAAAGLLADNGCVPRLLDLIGECWRDNLDRHDPQKGDDARTLGFTTAANISNRVLGADLGDDAEAVAVDGWAVIRSGGYEIKIYKLPGQSANVSPDAIDWTGSDSKERGGRENAAAVQLALFPVRSDGGGHSPLLRRLHLVHTADEESGEVVYYLGFPRLDDDGAGPWFAVMQLHASHVRMVVPQSSPSQAEMPTFDQLPEPDLELRVRTGVAARPEATGQ